MALLEFDLRKLKSISIPELDGVTSIGISNYLTGQVTDLASIHKSLASFPLLHIYRTGPLPYNPAELIIGDAMGQLMEYVKANYDYVIMDSAPSGLVSDSFTLANFADAVLYVLRQRYTFKTQLTQVEELKNAKSA